MYTLGRKILEVKQQKLVKELNCLVAVRKLMCESVAISVQIGWLVLGVNGILWS